MRTEARVGMMMEGGGNSPFSAVHSGAALKYPSQRQSQLQHHHQQPQVGALSHLVAGGVAGVVSKTCTAPLARLTILMQVQGMHSSAAALRKASVRHEAYRIVCEEGFRAFWKGNLVTIVHRLPYSSVSFCAYDQYKNLLNMILGTDKHTEYSSADVCVRLIGGGLAGMTAATVTYPLDLVRTRLATQTNQAYYQGIWHAVCAISRDEGLRGLYKGLGATLLSVGPNLAISFSAYETLRSNWQLRRPQDSNILMSLACGSVSGIASSTVIFPLDLVRRRMQLEGAAGRAHVYKSGVFGTIKHVICSEGFRGLYRGILPEYYKVVPSIGIAFSTYEILKSWLSDIDVFA